MPLRSNQAKKKFGVLYSSVAYLHIFETPSFIKHVPVYHELILYILTYSVIYANSISDVTLSLTRLKNSGIQSPDVKPASLLLRQAYRFTVEEFEGKKERVPLEGGYKEFRYKRRKRRIEGV